MKNTYFIYPFLSILFFASCRNPKMIYNDTPINLQNGNIQGILKAANAEATDKSIIVFTSWFERDTIKIINGEEIIFDKVIQTSPDTGLSAIKPISNDKTVSILILSPNHFDIKLKKTDLQKYKFVYIKRDAWKRNKYSLEYSNEWKKFM
jgi:hypothetical protein